MFRYFVRVSKSGFAVIDGFTNKTVCRCSTSAYAELVRCGLEGRWLQSEEG